MTIPITYTACNDPTVPFTYTGFNDRSAVLDSLQCVECWRSGLCSTDLRSRSADSLHQPDEEEESLTESADHGDDLTSAGKKYPVYSYPERRGSEAAGNGCRDCSSYVVVEVATERTPLQGPVTAPLRPSIASLYDEYGELSGTPTTELLSPCGSEECLLNTDFFRSQTESVV